MCVCVCVCWVETSPDSCLGLFFVVTSSTLVRKNKKKNDEIPPSPQKHDVSSPCGVKL